MGGAEAEAAATARLLKRKATGELLELEKKKKKEKLDIFGFLKDFNLTHNATRLAAGLIFAYLANDHADEIHMRIEAWKDRMSWVKDGGALPGPDWVYAFLSPSLYARFVLAKKSAEVSIDFADILADYKKDFRQYLKDMLVWDQKAPPLVEKVEVFRRDLERAERLLAEHEQSKPVLEDFPYPGTNDLNYEAYKAALAAWETQRDAYQRMVTVGRKNLATAEENLEEHKTVKKPKEPEKHPAMKASTNERLFYTTIAFLFGFYPTLIPSTISSAGDLIKGVAEVGKVFRPGK